MTCKEHDPMIEKLWELVDTYDWYSKPITTGELPGYDQGFLAANNEKKHLLTKLLPPRPPRQPRIVENLTLQQAIEGLRDGKYSRAQPQELMASWAVWEKNTLVDEGESDWSIERVDMGPWRAEVSG